MQIIRTDIGLFGFFLTALVIDYILSKGVYWTVGTNSNIKIWSDPWLPKKVRFRSYGPRVQNPGVELVGELLNENGDEWNCDLIRNICYEEDVEAILSIPTRRLRGTDKLSWNFSKDGIYSVRTGYEVAMKEKQQDGASASDTSGMRKLWNFIWGLGIPEKIKIFLWKCTNGILPVKVGLRKRGVTVDSMCSRCGQACESVEHVARDCSWSNFYWRASPLRFQGILLDGNGSFADWIDLVREKLEDEGRCLFAWLLWNLWYSRNQLEFHQKQIPVQLSFERSISLMHEFNNAAMRGRSVHIAGACCEVWHPPRSDFFKINSDASIPSNGGSGVGAVIRGSMGEVVSSICKYYSEKMEVDFAEALGIWEGINMAASMGLSKVIIETDSASVFHKLKKNGSDLSYLGVLVQDIISFCSTFESFRFSLVRRTANSLAHSLARHVFLLILAYFWRGWSLHIWMLLFEMRLHPPSDIYISCC
ncbi:hypothetical protein OROMI_023824 [Orobanche minor]